MKENLEIRRRITAEQIKNAMAKAGMTRSQLAAALGKKPSVITQWLSGNHNFTLDSLAEISSVLGQQITGVDVPLKTNGIVDGYSEDRPKETGEFHDSCSGEYCINWIQLTQSEYSSLREQAVKLGVSLKRYAELILGREAARLAKDAEEEEREKTERFLKEFAGIWSGPEYDGIEEAIYATRTIWKGDDL